MEEDIQKFLTDRKRRLLCTAITMFVAACAMTFGFYSSGRAMVTMSGNELLVREIIFGLIVTGVATAILWCICIQYAEAFMFMKFISQLIANMKQMGVESMEKNLDKKENMTDPNEGKRNE